jgi:hypothetical protein
VILFGLSAAIACAAAFSVAQHLGRWLRGESATAADAPTETECQGLVVAASDLDLGDLWDCNEFVRNVAIHNPANSDKSIKDFVTSCLCTAVEPRSLTVPAAGTATVQVRIDPNHRSPDEVGLAVRPFALEITPITSTSRPHEAGWKFHGVFKSRVTLNALSVHFGETVVKDAVPPTRKAVAIVHVPMQHLDAKVEPAGVAAVKVVPNPDQPDRVEIHITPANTLPTGIFKASVIVEVVDCTGQVRPGATLPIAGNVQPEARLLPARVMLGSHPVGTTAEAIVVLQAPHDAAWTVDHIEADSQDVSAEATTAEGIPSGRAFRVRQRATREGNQTDTVRFVVRKGGETPLTLAMEVMCHGELLRDTVSPQDGEKHP